MNKLKISIIALVASMFMTVTSFAGVTVGLSAALAGIEASGTETLKDSSAIQSHTEQANAVIPSVFLELDGIVTTYLIKSFDSGLFVKLGVASADVNTKEVLGTGTTYGNTSVDGAHYGIGFQRTNDSGLFIRAAAEYTDFDSLSLTGSQVGGTASSFNVIKADVDVAMAKFSIGKAF